MVWKLSADHYRKIAHHSAITRVELTGRNELAAKTGQMLTKS